jgi:hypothetical protein
LDRAIAQLDFEMSFTLRFSFHLITSIQTKIGFHNADGLPQI